MSDLVVTSAQVSPAHDSAALQTMSRQNTALLVVTSYHGNSNHDSAPRQFQSSHKISSRLSAASHNTSSHFSAAFHFKPPHNTAPLGVSSPHVTSGHCSASQHSMTSHTRSHVLRPDRKAITSFKYFIRSLRFRYMSLFVVPRRASSIATPQPQCRVV